MFESTLNAVSDFHFIRPLWLLAIAPVLLLSGWLLTAQRQNKRWSGVIDADLLEHLLDAPAGVRKRWPITMLSLAWLIACIALAGPSWQRLPQAVEKKADIMVVIVDMTLSMYATDITPSRLLRARYKLLQLLAQRKEGQTALISYSGDAHVVSPLTDDSKTIAALVPALSPEIMPTIGSNAGAAFNIAAELIGTSGSRSARIVWFTDELLNKDRQPIETVLARYDIDLVTIGIGSEHGGLIKMPDGKFVKDNRGKLITAKLNRAEIQQFVAAQGGRYIDLRSDNQDIDYALSESLFEANEAGQIDGGKSVRQDRQRTIERWRDQGVWLVLLLIPVALLSFRRGWLLSVAVCVMLIMPPETYAATWQDLWLTKDQQASKALEQGKVDEAAELFDDAQWKGAANFQSGNFAEAAKSLEGVDTADAHYNRGHALAHDGKLEAAVAAYDRALALQPDMDDAKKSKSLIEQLLKQRQEQQGQQGEGENNDPQQGDAESDQPQSSDQHRGSNSASDTESEQQQGQAGEQEVANENGQDAQEQDHADKDKESPSSLENKSADNDEQNDGQTMQQLSAADQLSAQQSEALQQWLRQIPDDPAGLLRRKFQYERQLRQREGSVVDAEEDGQIW